jgi:membrane-bound inhibitor of C-type lysozyme
MRPPVALLCLAAFGISLPQGYAADDTVDIIQNVYVCERGAVIPVAYINTDDGDSYAVAVIEGRQVAMTLAPSGSGARYISINEQESYRWHSQGDEAILSFLAADHTAEEEVLLMDCRSQAK